MDKYNTMFRCDSGSGIDLRVGTFESHGCLLEAGRSDVEVSLSVEDSISLAAHLAAEFGPYTDPAVMLAWGKAIVADALARMPSTPKPTGYTALSDQAKTVFQHMQRAGSISVREAMNDYGIAGGTLSRRIVDIQEAGFGITKTRRKHPMTGRLYTRYSLERPNSIRT